MRADIGSALGCSHGAVFKSNYGRVREVGLGIKIDHTGIDQNEPQLHVRQDR